MKEEKRGRGRPMMDEECGLYMYHSTVRLPVRYRSSIYQAAGDSGMSVTQWIRTLIVCQLEADGLLTESENDEATALVES